jgi:hypothetical protein
MGEANPKTWGARLPRPPRSGAPLLGEADRAPRQPPAREWTIRNDPAQLVIPGTEASAHQAQAARDQAGRGALLPRVDQAPCCDGLFAYRPEQPGLAL